MRTEISDEVLEFVQEEINFAFGHPKRIISDNGRCFTARRVQAFMEEKNIQWRKVLEYAPMSNGRAERMVGSIKKALAESVYPNGQPWTKYLPSVVFGYRRKEKHGNPSPFELMCGTSPRMNGDDPACLGTYPFNFSTREVELMTTLSDRARQCEKQRKQVKRRKEKGKCGLMSEMKF